MLYPRHGRWDGHVWYFGAYETYILLTVQGWGIYSEALDFEFSLMPTRQYPGRAGAVLHAGVHLG